MNNSNDQQLTNETHIIQLLNHLPELPQLLSFLPQLSSYLPQLPQLLQQLQQLQQLEPQQLSHLIQLLQLVKLLNKFYNDNLAMSQSEQLRNTVNVGQPVHSGQLGLSGTPRTTIRPVRPDLTVGYKSYICPICYRRFWSSGSLNKHKNIHRTFRCL
jgi:hypothetical protein